MVRVIFSQEQKTKEDTMNSLQKETLSPVELYAFHFQNPEPKYYARVPNIIDHLTYQIEVDGKKETKRLSVYAKELYRVIRMITNDYGKCWHSTKSLAEIVGCSTGSISNAKNELLMPMDQLDGNPLIIETERTTIKRLDDGHAIPVPLITRGIVDIWKWNNAFMATRKFQNEYGRDSCGEQPEDGDSCGEQPSLDRCSCGEPNNNPVIKNPMFIEQQPTADADCVVFKSSKKEKERAMLPSEAKKAFEWMIKKKCDPVAALDIAKKFTPDEIHQASGYVMNQMKKNYIKNKKIDNVWGYLRTVLDRKFYLQKCSS